MLNFENRAPCRCFCLAAKSALHLGKLSASRFIPRASAVEIYKLGLKELSTDQDAPSHGWNADLALTDGAFGFTDACVSAIRVYILPGLDCRPSRAPSCSLFEAQLCRHSHIGTHQEDVLIIRSSSCDLAEVRHELR